MTAIGLGAAMNDGIINDLNNEIAGFKELMNSVMYPGLLQDMDFEALRSVLFRKQNFEIEIEKREMQLKIEKIKIEIVKLDELRKKTNVNQVSVEDKKKMRLLGYNINNKDHRKLLSETMPLVEEKMKQIGFMNNYHHPDPDDHDLKLMNTELKSNIEKLNLLKREIYKMESWIDEMKKTKMKIKDITKPDVECACQVLQFNDEESSDNELETYKYNKEKMHSFWVKSSSINFARATQALEEKKQMKANGLDFAKKNGRRAIMQYWHLPLKEPKQLLRGYWKKLELPKKGGFLGWDGLEKWPVTLQIYSLKLRPCCCSDDDQEEDCSVVVSGEISLLIDSGDEPSIIHVRRQIITKKDPYVLLDDPTYIPFPFSFNPPPMIHAKLVFTGSDEPDKLTRSMEVVDEVHMSGKEFSEGTSALSEDVNLGTGKHYRLKLTHGIVVNTVVANISVHLPPSLLDKWDRKCKITASGKDRTCRPVVLANYKKVPLTLDDKGCLQLLRPRICVDFFGVLDFYMKCFGSSACLCFIPRDCYSRDNCERKKAHKGITVQVRWSTG